MSARAAFWVVIAVLLLHLSARQGFILGLVYLACTAFDHWRANVARKKVFRAIEYETDGWEIDPDRPERENKGNAMRTTLPNEDEIVVTRVARILYKMEAARLYDLP